MGLCSSSSTSTDVLYAENADAQTYEAQMERIEKEKAKNVLTIYSFTVLTELGCGLAEVYAEEPIDKEDKTEELDGIFSTVIVQGQAKDRQLRMRTFLRKYLLRGGKESASIRIAPFVSSINLLGSVKLNQYILSLEHAFFNRTDCILICNHYVTDLELLIRHGFCPKIDEALGIVCSILLALQHLHSYKITAGDTFLNISNIVVTLEGRSKLSLLPLSATRIGYQRKERLDGTNADDDKGSDDNHVNSSENNNKEGSGDSQQYDSSFSSSATSSDLKESPGAKYRIQTKQSEVRGDQNIDAKTLRKKIARDYLLLGRLAATVFGLYRISNNQHEDDAENENENTAVKDKDISKKAETLNEPQKSIIIGLLHSNHEERFNYKSIKMLLPDYEWDKMEDIKEEIYPPISIHPTLLNEININILEEAQKKEEGADIKIEEEEAEQEQEQVEGEEKVKETEKEMNTKENDPDDNQMETKDDEPDEDDAEFLDHGDDHDEIESDYGDEDKLLPWEAAEILHGWDHNSQVKSLHQLSNHIQSDKLADFASYDATYYKPQVISDVNEDTLRTDLKEIGKIMEKEVKKSSAGLDSTSKYA